MQGDISFDILKYEHNKCVNEFLNLIFSNFLQPCITEPTKNVGNNRPALLLSILLIHLTKMLIVLDHMPNFVIMRDILDTKKPQRTVIRDIENFNKEKYLKDFGKY